MKQALIVFTELPDTGEALTRLRPYYTKDQCAGLHEAYLRDIYDVISDSLADIFVFHSEGDEERIEHLQSIFEKAELHTQKGVTFEGRLYDAMSRVFNMGYSRVLLMESTMPDFDGKDINKAFDILTRSDFVFGPLDDGSYWCIGAKFDNDVKSMMPIFSVDFTSEHILDDTIEILPSWKTYELLDEKGSVSCIDELLIMREKHIGGHTEEFLEKNHILSVIVPVNDAAVSLDKTFKQISKFKGRAEVIFVDGRDADVATDKLKDFTRANLNCKYIRNSQGKGAAVNLGVEAANGDVLMFIDPDCELMDNPLEEILRVMDYCKAGYFEIEYRGGGLAMWYNKMCRNSAAKKGIVTIENGMFMMRDVFFENGMFKENTPMEDIDFAAGLKIRGQSIKPARTKIYPGTSRYSGGFLSRFKQVRLENSERSMYFQKAASKPLLEQN